MDIMSSIRKGMHNSVHLSSSTVNNDHVPNKDHNVTTLSTVIHSNTNNHTNSSNTSSNGILHPSASIVPNPPSSASEEDAIMVSVRVRPLNGRELVEIQNNDDDLANSTPWQYNDTTVMDEEPGTGRKVYNFDRVLGTQSTNAETYDRVARRVVQMALKGYNGTVFAYGQTGSGKTHSMLGTAHDPGIIPRAVHDIFRHIEQATGGLFSTLTNNNLSNHHILLTEPSTEFLVRVSYLEVYNEEINDLLQPLVKDKGKNLKILKDDPSKGAIVEGLVEEIVVSREQVLEIVARGEANRHYGITNVHSGSSRSHTIFRMIIESKTSINNGSDDDRTPRGNNNNDNNSDSDDDNGTRLRNAGRDQRIKGNNGSSNDNNNNIVHVSYLNLVDLAGSERQEFAGTSGERLREGGFINKSLSALAHVISKLVDANKRQLAIEKNSQANNTDNDNDNEDDNSSISSFHTNDGIGINSMNNNNNNNKVPFTPRKGPNIVPATPRTVRTTVATRGRTVAPSTVKRSSLGSNPNNNSSSVLPVPTASSQTVTTSSQDYIPYRNSKLTRLLRQSIGGNAFTSILCTITPAILSHEESVSTLKFGVACKKIRNKVTCNTIIDDKTLLRQYRQKITELRTQIASFEKTQAHAQAQAQAALALLAVHSEPDATAVVAASEKGGDALAVLSPLIHRAVAAATARKAPRNESLTNDTENGSTSALTVPPHPRSRTNRNNDLSDFGFESPTKGSNISSKLNNSNDTGTLLDNAVKELLNKSPRGEQLAKALAEAEASRTRAEDLERTVSRLQGLIIGGTLGIRAHSPRSGEAAPIPTLLSDNDSIHSNNSFLQSPPATASRVRRRRASVAVTTGVAALNDRFNTMDFNDTNSMVLPTGRPPLLPSTFRSGDTGTDSMVPSGMSANQVVGTLRAVRQRLRDASADPQGNTENSLSSSALTTEITRLQQRVTEAESTTAAKIRELSEARNDIDRMTLSLKDAQAALHEASNLKSRLTSAETRAKEAEEQYDQLRKKHDFELAQLRDRQAAAISDALEASKRKGVSETSALIERITNLENELYEIQEARVQLGQEVESLRKESSGLQRDVEEAGKAVDSAHQRAIECEENAHSAHTEAESANDRASTAEQRAAEALLRAKEAEEATQRAYSEAEVLEKAAKDAVTAVENRDKMLEERYKMLLEREQVLEAMVSNVETAKQQVDEMHKEASRLRDEAQEMYNTTKDDIETQRRQNEAERTALQLSMAQFHEAEARLTDRVIAQDEREQHFHRRTVETNAMNRIHRFFRYGIVQTFAHKSLKVKDKERALQQWENDIERRHTQLREKEDELKAKVNDFSIDLDALESKMRFVEGKENQYLALETELNERLQAVNAREQRVQALEENLAERNTIMEKGVAHMDEREAQLKVREEKVMTIESTIDARMTETLMHAERQAEEADARLRQVLVQAAEVDARAVELEASREELHRQHTVYQKQLDNLNGLMETIREREMNAETKEKVIEERETEIQYAKMTIEAERLRNEQMRNQAITEIERREEEANVRILETEAASLQRVSDGFAETEARVAAAEKNVCEREADIVHKTNLAREAIAAAEEIAMNRVRNAEQQLADQEKQLQERIDTADKALETRRTEGLQIVMEAKQRAEEEAQQIKQTMEKEMETYRCTVENECTERTQHATKEASHIIANAETAAEQRKKEMYEKTLDDCATKLRETSTQIDEMLLSAQEQCTETIVAAEQRSKELINTAEQEAQNLRDQGTAAATDKLNLALQQVEELTQEAQQTANQIRKEAQDELDRAHATIQKLRDDAAEQGRVDAKNVVEEAKQTAQQTIREAEAKAQQTLQEAENKADELLSTTITQATTLVEETQKHSAQLLEAAESHARSLRADAEKLHAAAAEAVAAAATASTELAKRSEELKQQEEKLLKQEEDWLQEYSTKKQALKTAEEISNGWHEVENQQRTLAASIEANCHENQELIQVRREVEEAKRKALTETITLQTMKDRIAKEQIEINQEKLRLTHLQEQLTKDIRNVHDERVKAESERQETKAALDKAFESRMNAVAACEAIVKVTEEQLRLDKLAIETTANEQKTEHRSLEEQREKLFQTDMNHKTKETELRTLEQKVQETMKMAEATKTAATQAMLAIETERQQFEKQRTKTLTDIMNAEQTIARDRQSIDQRFQDLETKEKLMATKEQEYTALLNKVQQEKARIHEEKAEYEADKKQKQAQDALTAVERTLPTAFGTTTVDIEKREQLLNKQKRKLENAAKMVATADASVTEREAVVTMREAALAAREAEWAARELPLSTNGKGIISSSSSSSFSSPTELTNQIQALARTLVALKESGAVTSAQMGLAVRTAAGPHSNLQQLLSSALQPMNASIINSAASSPNRDFSKPNHNNSTLNRTHASTAASSSVSSSSVPTSSLVNRMMIPNNHPENFIYTEPTSFLNSSFSSNIFGTGQSNITTNSSVALPRKVSSVPVVEINPAVDQENSSDDDDDDGEEKASYSSQGKTDSHHHHQLIGENVLANLAQYLDGSVSNPPSRRNSLTNNTTTTTNNNISSSSSISLPSSSTVSASLMHGLTNNRPAPVPRRSTTTTVGGTTSTAVLEENHVKNGTINHPASSSGSSKELFTAGLKLGAPVAENYSRWSGSLRSPPKH